MKRNRATRDKGAGKNGINGKTSEKIEKNAKRDDVRGKTMREKFAELFELPKELVLDIPRITIVGKSDMMIENYKGVIEYDSDRIKINTGIGIVKITGAGLIIKEITSEDIIVSGGIHSLDFV
jgi:sporulation protein YqfC